MKETYKMYSFRIKSGKYKSSITINEPYSYFELSEFQILKFDCSFNIVERYVNP